MEKAHCEMLKAKAEEVARNYSNPDRQNNFNKSTFTVKSITPLSATTACVIFKQDTGRESLCFFYWINGSGGYWAHFMPSDSHIMGMKKLEPILWEVEKHNWRTRFPAGSMLSGYA